MTIRMMSDWPIGWRCRGVAKPLARGATPALLPHRSVRRTDQRGSAILVVLILMLALAAIVVANTQTLRLLKQEILLVDQEQQQKYDPGPGQ